MCKRCYDGYDFPDHRERNVYRLEDEDETPYKRKGRGKKVCKRSKDGQHDWSGRVPKMVWGYWTEWVRDGDSNRLVKVDKKGYREKQITVCAKCGKPQTYLWRYSF